jgi:hypothetical protein
MAFNNIVNNIRTGIGIAGTAVNAVEGLIGANRTGGQKKFNVSKIQSALSQNGGLLEPSMALLRMTAPMTLAGDSRPINFLANSMNLPTKSLDVIDHKRLGYGVSDKRVQGGGFGDLVVTFFVSNDGEPLIFFNEWLESIFSTDASSGEEAEKNGFQVFNIRYREDYIVNMEVIVHSKTQDEVFIYKFHEAFPTNIGDVQFEWGATDQFAVVGIPFTYRFYTIDKIPAPKLSVSSGGILSQIKNGLGVLNRLSNSAPARNILQGLNVASAQKLF